MVGQVEGHRHIGRVVEQGLRLRGHIEVVRVVGKQHQCGQRRRADRVTLGDRLGGIAHRVEWVGDAAHLRRQVGHLGNAAGVVGDRAVRVQRHDHAGHRQHGRGSNRDAVKAAERKRTPDRKAHRDHRQRGRFHRHTQAGNDVGAVPGGRGRRDVRHRLVLRAGVVLGHPHDHPGQQQPDQRAAPQVDRAVAEAGHQLRGDWVERGRSQYRGNDHTLVQRAHDRAALLHLDEQRADDRGDDRYRAQQQRVQHGVRADLFSHQAAEEHGRDHGYRVSFEQVGGHAGAVAHVVAHVVRDHGRIARVVLGNAGLDLADQVRAHVRTLGKDAAAQARKNRDQRAAEGQADQRMQRQFAMHAHLVQHDPVAGHAEQGQPDHQHAGDRAAAKRNVHRRAEPVTRRLRRTHIGAHGDIHADIAGGARKNRAEQKADRRRPVEKEADQ